MSEVEVTQADRDAVTAFHIVQAKRILAGDRSLGENRDAIEQAFARHRTASIEAATADLRERLAEVEGVSAKLRDILVEASFLWRRLEGLDWSQDFDGFARDYNGHVAPSQSRLGGMIAKIDALLGEPK